jgi:hypothetical protein
MLLVRLATLSAVAGVRLGGLARALRPPLYTATMCTSGFQLPDHLADMQAKVSEHFSPMSHHIPSSCLSHVIFERAGGDHVGRSAAL